jgi:hypothetical protein
LTLPATLPVAREGDAMRLIGVEMAERALAELALRLDLLGETELARRINAAAEEDRDQLPLTGHEQTVMLQVLVNPPADLHELHRALLLAWARRPQVL